ncbi:SMC-Scp complex subunit ScpB [Gallaecimonas kandeliae]|uniref:SMC-Scp complex subunit ScpB n=1 Tax=Gallaecimonas kandeliae TaxID=3029055 RepID=UPI002649596B|nr:SMC-Scp complex subunit ScpB [Gallaecimonas kandeliae]WKE66937.1 SMC-Scp complex subunit ScpB [Gallaecimonas kandeliae]
MAKISDEQLKQVLEAALFVAGRPLSAQDLLDSVLAGYTISRPKLTKALQALELDYRPRGIQLVEVASGWRFQANDALSPLLSRLWVEKAPRYSRATLETLALIAYRQPITRGEIEEVRGVAVSTQIIRTLEERGWIRVVGTKEVPGRPALFGTTRQFLDDMNLKSLGDLPELMDITNPAERLEEETP